MTGCWLCAEPHDGFVNVVRTSNHAIVASVPVGPAPNRIAIMPDGSGSVKAFRTGDHKVETVSDVGVNPPSMAPTPDCGRLYVANSGSGTVSVYRTSDSIRSWPRSPWAKG